MRKLFSLSLIILLIGVTVFAQTSRGVVSGTVTDPNGSTVPGAEVTLTNIGTTVSRSVVTNDQGFYRFDAVDLGNYSIRVAASNFGPIVKNNIVVNANQTSSVDAELALGNQEIVIEVTGDAGAQLQTEAAVRGGNISTRQITELPVAGNPTALALTLPGVVTNRTGVGIGTFSVNGARGRSNNFLIDGTENNDISVAGQGFQITNRDAVQEVSVQTGNYDSEFGRAGGAIVNTITRSGTSDFRGTLAFQYDSSKDDAITSLQSRNPAVLALGRPLFNDEKVYSGTFGGPLFLPNFGEGGPVLNTSRDRNFFFVGYLENRFRSPGGSVTLVVPTAAGRATLQQFAGTNPRVAEYLNLTANTVATVANRPSVSLDPLGSTTQVRGSVAIGEFFRTFSNTTTTKQFQIRTDHRLTDNDQLSFRLLSDITDSPLSTVNFPGFDSNQANRYYNFLIAETHVFSSSTTNELRLAYNRIKLSFPLADPTGPAVRQATISLAGLTSVGVPTNIPQGRTADNYQIQDTVTHIFGDHTFRVGVDYLRQISTQLAPADIRGTLTYGGDTTNFSSLANFIDDFGGPGGSVNRVFGDPVYNPTLQRIATFVQDRWKATDDLTLTMGVRYENFGTPFNKLRTPAYTGLFNVDPSTRTGPFSRANQVAKDNNNFSPSVGFAYSPSFEGGIGGFIFGEKKSVIRAGYNIGYDSFFNNIASNAAASSPNQIAINIASTISTANPRGLSGFSNRFPTVAPTSVSAASAQTLIDPNLENPYYQRWSLGFQRELPFSLVMDVSYVGSKGTNLYINEDANPLVRPELRITPPGVTTGLTGRYDNLQGARTVRTNGGDSNYHSGQFELRRRFVNNFTVTGSYTFSKLINNADEVFAVGIATAGSVSAIPAVFGGQERERGLSVDDRTHRVAFTYVAESPFFKEQKGVLGRVLGGFQFSGVTTFESGVPFTVFNILDADGIGGGNDRPTYNPNGQRGVRAVPLVEPQFLPGPGNVPNPNYGAIIGYVNPEIIIRFIPCSTPGCTPTPVYSPIDPNTAQFIVNPAYIAGAPRSIVRVGNLGRNTERSPSVYNTNLTLLKRTRISERIFFEARAELFNAFNKPNFPSAGTILSSANSLTQGLFLNPDTITTSGGGRVTRYQVKLVF